MLAGCGGAPDEPLPSAALETTASIRPEQLRVGDLADVAVHVAHPPDSTVAFPPLDRDKEIVVRSADVRTDVADQDLAITSARWQITSFRTGEFAVCTNAIVIRAANGDVTEASFPFLGFSVLTTLTNDLRALTPDKGLAAWPASLPRWIPGLLIVALLAFLVALLILFLIRRSSRERAAPPLPPAHRTALQALERLRRKGYLENSDYEPFYVEVSAIIRLYIERQFAIDAPDLTTEEFLEQAANASELRPEHRELCRDFLTQCDLVKFAMYEPGKPAMESVLESAVRLVKETTMVMAVEPAEGVAA